MPRFWGQSDSRGDGISTWIEQSAARGRHVLRSAGSATRRAWCRGGDARPLAQRARHALGELHDRSWLGIHRRSLFLGTDGAVRPFDAEVWAPFLTRTILRSLRLGDIVVDAGASVGYHALLFARRVGDRGHVFAFEPEPVQFSLLKMNVEASGQPNLTLASKALHRANTNLHLDPADPRRSTYRLHETPRGPKSVAVHAVRLDDFFGALDRPVSLVRIDLGGGECAALEGMRSLAKSNRDMKLMVHCAPAALRSYGATVDGLLGEIEALGFRTFAVDLQARAVLPVERGAGLPGADRDRPAHLLCMR